MRKKGVLLYGKTPFWGKIAKYETEKSVDCLVGGISAHFSDCVLEHYILLEEVIYRHFVLGVVVHRALEIEAEETLYAVASCACCEVAEEYEVEAKRCGED